MKKLTFYIFLFIFPILGQAQDFWCGSSGGGGVVAAVSGFTSSSTTEYEIRVYLHIVKNSSGTQGVSSSEAMTSYNEMVSDFSPYGICFSLAELDSILNDDFMSFNDKCLGGAKIDTLDDNDYEELFSTNSHTNGIDIYLLPDDWSRTEGRAWGIPGTAFLVGGSLSLENNLPLRSMHVLTHEMGHCLGLSHPSRGTVAGENKEFITCGFIQCDVCPELVNGDTINKTTCGDYIFDTPADPLFNPYSISPQLFLDTVTCTWTNTQVKDSNNDLYMPDGKNYMGRTRAGCYSRFSPGQVVRMKTFLQNSPVLSPLIVSTNSCTQIVQRTINKTDYKKMFNNTEWIDASDFFFEGYRPFRIYQEKDTIVNGKTYHIITKETIKVDGLLNDPVVLEGSKTTEIYREDIENQQVWAVSDDYEREFLVFDFSLQLGDAMLGDTSKVLDKIEIIQLNGEDHRQLTFVSLSNQSIKFVWIEGIGNVVSPLSSGAFFFEPNAIAGLLCASQNGELLYNERAVAINLPEPCSNYITVPTQNIPLLDPSLSLFPNPGDTYITLKSDVLVGEIVSWSIRDVLGRAIITEAQTRLSANFQIDIEQLDAGTYFLTLANKNGQQTLRFVKQ